MVVEITPIGIQSIGWKFWVIWTVFNAAFLPAIYLFYPETGEQHASTSLTKADTPSQPDTRGSGCLLPFEPAFDCHS